jgi:acyl carrier protein
MGLIVLVLPMARKQSWPSLFFASYLLAFAPAAEAADCIDPIKRLIVKHWEVAAQKVVPGARLKEDLNADALDRVELTMALEEEFNISIDDKDADMFVTVADVAAYINPRAKNTKRCR